MNGRTPCLTPITLARTMALAFSIFVTNSAHASTFIFSTFKGDPVPLEQLSIYESADALSLKLFSDTGFSGPSGALRDPSIMKYKDGKYYVAYTDPLGAGCCGKEDHFSIASSADLVHWTNLTMVKGGVPGVAHVWAPEWFVDGSTVYLIVNMDTLNTDSDFKPYIFSALDDSLTSWSGPVALGIGPNYIDAFAIRNGTTYHVFAKQETTRYVEHATAPKLTGPWTFVGKGDFAGWGGGMEGPVVVQLDDGHFRIFMDAQGSAGFVYADSADLMTWSKATSLPALANTVRHGTIIRDMTVGDGGASGSAGVGGSGGQGAAAAGGMISGTGGTIDTGGGPTFAGSGAISGGAGLLETGGWAGAGGVSGAAGTSASGGFVARGGMSASGGSEAVSPLPGAPSHDPSCGCAVPRRSSSRHALWLAALLATFRLGARRRRRWRLLPTSPS